MTLTPVDATNAVAVTDYLTKARDWLSTAVETSTPHAIASAKAELTVAAEATKQLDLSKEIQLDAQEMVRRAEFALGKAIRKGQADGSIAKRGDIGGNMADPTRSSRGDDLVRPADLVPHTHERHALYAMADAGVEVFEDALTEAKGEGSPSRANVLRKVTKVVVSPVPTTREGRADLIVNLANQGFSSRQMPAKVGVSEESIRQIARDYDIDIPADRSIARTRRINSTDVVVNTATALEGLVSGVALIEYADVDPAVASQWVDSLTDSLKKLRRFVDQIKETTQ